MFKRNEKIRSHILINPCRNLLNLETGCHIKLLDLFYITLFNE